jgi:hypothetical protein
VVKLPFHSATIATLVLALLVTQTGSFVCNALCVQHQLGGRTAGHNAAMTHCHSMPQSAAPGASVQTCPAHSLCVVDILANSQGKTVDPLLIQAHPGPDGLLPGFVIPAVILFYAVPRSSVSDPPLITPLRV